MISHMYAVHMSLAFIQISGYTGAGLFNKQWWSIVSKIRNGDHYVAIYIGPSHL